MCAFVEQFVPCPAMNANAFISRVTSRWSWKYFTFSKLPSLWWWGVRCTHLDAERCEVHIPFRWQSQNPFQSIYFAAQTGAAELSTGLPVLMALQTLGPHSMLVTATEIKFLKKAKSNMHFVCVEVAMIASSIAQAGPEGTVFWVHTKGILADGTVATEARFQWSVKRKQ